MANIAKRIIKKSRDKLLANITNSINELKIGIDSKLDLRVSTLQENILDIIQETRAELLKVQYEASSDLNEKILNSGTLIFSEKEMVAKIFNGQKIYLDPRDISVAPHIALDSVWEYPVTVAWLSLVQASDIVLDIGANFGYFGMLAAKNADKKDSKIIFFEANSNLIPYINKTLSINWLHEQTVVENLAISDNEGELKLNVLKDYIGSSSLHPIEYLDKYVHNKMHLETQEVISVKSTTIDAYCERNKIKSVNLIKMDIEGFEEKAYKGMRKIVALSSSITLFIEFTRDSYKKPKAFYEQLLEDFGHIYNINTAGQLIKPLQIDYESVTNGPDDLIMLVFSKNSKLAHH